MFQNPANSVVKMHPEHAQLSGVIWSVMSGNGLKPLASIAPRGGLEHELQDLRDGKQS